jgi:hypothetical protein
MSFLGYGVRRVVAALDFDFAVAAVRRSSV